MREDNGKPRELTYESLIKDVSVTGVTEYEHVVKHARRLMAIEALRPKVTTIEVGNEGIFYTPMSKVLIQDDCLKIGLGNAVISGCDWRGGRLKKIYLNGTVPVPDVDKAYGVIVNCFTRDGGKPVAIKVEAERAGDVSELTVVSAVRISDDAVPDVGNVLSFGELDADGGFSRVTTPYIINGIKRGEKGFSLELVNYHEAVYDAGAIPEYHSNLTRRQGTLPPPIPKDYGGITRDELEKALARVDGTKAAQKAAQEAADLIVHGVRYTDTHYIRDVEMSLPDIVKRIDNDARTLSSSIEMSEEQILLKVEDTAQGLRSFIAVTKEQILAEAEDLKRELKGLLAVQAGAVKAMVEGGGAAGQLALSLELPAMIDKKTFNKFVEKCGGEATAKVYARLAGTDYYAIRGDISGKPVKALWDKAVKAGLLASQIQLNADQIVVQNGDKVAAAFVDGKLRAACIDAENLIVQQLKIDSDKQSNQDFEAYFDKNRGLQIRNKGADILKIDPKTGEAFFNGRLNAVESYFSGIVTARDISLDGFRAGNIVLRKFANMTARTETKQLYSQICGTGEVRLKFQFKSPKSRGHTIVIKIDSKVIDTILVTDINTVKSYSKDLDIKEGNYIGIIATHSHSAGLYIVGDELNIFDIQICTNGKNGILAYLGNTYTTSTDNLTVIR